MGELDKIKMLPGMVEAAADTLHKAWRAGIDLASRAAGHPGLEAIAGLEAAGPFVWPSFSGSGKLVETYNRANLAEITSAEE